MKRWLIIVLAVAILGLLGFYASGRSRTNQPGSQPSASQSGSSNFGYKDGTYTGNNAETPYGTVQIGIVIKGGKIVDVTYLKMPDGEERSREITAQAEPLLKQTTLDKQKAGDIDFVSGATSTSYGYQESLQAALDQAAA